MIDSFSANYVSDEKGNREEYIRWLENARLGEGEGRHNGLVILGTSFYYRYANGWLHFTDDQRKAKLSEWNQKQKVPKPEEEFNQVWNWIVEHHRRERDRKHEELRNDKRMNLFTDMPGCISYKINSNPDRYIVGTPDNKIVEIECKWIQNKQNPGTLTMVRIQSRTFTACKPTKIIKHKNPLSFLEIRQKYTIEFKGSEQSGNFTIRHKTLGEIVSELKNGNALSENGLDIAITAQIKGFEERGLLEISDSMDYTGFFTTEEGKNIIISNLEIKQDPINVSDSLKYIDELSKYFEGRLDLLAHILLFAMIAPCSFIFKVIGAPLLEWIHPYGSSNAGNQVLGKTVFCPADGNENDDDFNLSIGHIDTIARFGETISKTTFPKLVDEVDVTDNLKLINNIKSAVDQIRFRKTLDRNRSVELVLALTPLILTSNPSPPLDDPSYLKRVTVRYFGKEEVHFPDDKVAIEYKNFLVAQHG